jgi:hypothetical protein
MKEAEIDKKIILIYEDGSVRIPHEGMHLCLDLTDIEFIYNESKKALNRTDAKFENSHCIEMK